MDSSNRPSNDFHRHHGETAGSEVCFEARMKSWKVDPQADCPLFIWFPPEIRRQIWEETMTPEFRRPPQHDFCVRHGHDDWHATPNALGPHVTSSPRPFRINQESVKGIKMFSECRRPDLPSRPTLAPHVLATCRRILCEARHLLFRNNDRCFWLSPNWDPAGICEYREVTSPSQWGEARGRWELRFTSRRLFMPINKVQNLQLWLWADGEPTGHTCYSNTLEHLRITFRRCDWTRRFRSPPSINPFSQGVGMDMLEMMEMTRDFSWPNGGEYTFSAVNSGTVLTATRQEDDNDDGGNRRGRPGWMVPIRLGRNCWGRTFVNTPRLKTLTIDFDISEDQAQKMLAIVEWAVRTWRFPVHTDSYLATDWDSVNRYTWRGLPGHWGIYCPDLQCQSHMWERRRGCREHQKIHENIMKGVGPRMVTWTVTWTRRKHDGPEKFPYGDWIAPSSHDIPPIKIIFRNQPKEKWHTVVPQTDPLGIGFEGTHVSPPSP